jgi:hypothetical protein
MDAKSPSAGIIRSHPETAWRRRKTSASSLA